MSSPPNRAVKRASTWNPFVVLPNLFCAFWFFRDRRSIKLRPFRQHSLSTPSPNTTRSTHHTQSIVQHNIAYPLISIRNVRNPIAATSGAPEARRRATCPDPFHRQRYPAHDRCPLKCESRDIQGCSWWRQARSSAG